MTIPIRDTFAPSGTGNYPLVRDENLGGSFRTVATINDRDTILSNLRKEGMLVFVVSDGKTYQLAHDMVTWNIYAGSAGAAPNVILPADPSPIVMHEIYVRTTGSDITGDGSLAHPYRTMVRALLDVPLFIRQTIYVIDITGITESLPNVNWNLPPFETDGSRYEDLAPAFPTFWSYTALTIRATPVILQTISAAHMVSWTPDPVTGLLTLKTDLALAPGALAGKIAFCQNSPDPWAVASNTATDIEFCNGATITPGSTLYICDPGATIQQTDAASDYPAVTVAGGNPLLTVMGVNFVHANVGAQSLYVQTGQQPSFRGCTIQGVSITQQVPANGPALPAPTLDGCVVTGSQFIGGDFANVYNCFFNQTAAGGGSGRGIVTYSATIFDGCESVGIPDSVQGVGDFWMASCDVRNATTCGVSAIGSLRTRIQDTNINDSAGSGVVASGAVSVTLSNVVGGGNVGYGLEVQNNAYVISDAGTTVTGTLGDVKRTDGVVETWAMWMAIGHSPIIASNVLLPDSPLSADTLFTIYVRPGGSDTTGDGTPAHPYATYVHARKQVPVFIPAHAFYLIDITGIDETLPTNYMDPPVFAAGPGLSQSLPPVNVVLGFHVTVAVNADMPVLLSITAPHVLSSAVDPVTTSQRTYHTDLVMAPNAYKGKVLLGSGLYEYAIVTANTATDIETAGMDSAFTAPLSICDYGATLRDDVANPAYAPTITFCNTRAPMQWAGVRFKDSRAADNSPYDVSVMVRADYELIFTCCEFESFTGMNAGAGNLGVCHLLHTTCIKSNGNNNGFFDGGTAWFAYGENECYTATFDGCLVAFGDDSPYRYYAGGGLHMAYVKIRNSPGHGILLNGASRAAIYRTTINNSVGSAIAADGCGHLFLFGGLLAGSGNGRYAIEITSGTQVYTDTSTLIGNLGALKCGSHAVMSWANWGLAGKVLNDLADADPQMCRISAAVGVA
jgi:hypothetical protein